MTEMKKYTRKGIQYVKFTDVITELEGIKNDLIEARKQSDKGVVKFFHRSMPMDNAGAIALGSLELKGTWAMTKVDIKYLKASLAIFDAMKIDSVIIAWSQDQPIVLGHRTDNEPMKISGVIIAPKVDN